MQKIQTSPTNIFIIINGTIIAKNAFNDYSLSLSKEILLSSALYLKEGRDKNKKKNKKLSFN